MKINNIIKSSPNKVNPIKKNAPVNTKKPKQKTGIEDSPQKENNSSNKNVDIKV